MKKLTLDLDDLAVASFTTETASAVRGTVKGHYGTTHTVQSCEISCPTICRTCEGDRTCFTNCNPGW